MKEDKLVDAIKKDFDQFLKQLNLDVMSKQFQAKLMQYVYSPDVLPELLHRFIAGTPKIYYNFQEPNQKLKVL